MPGDSYKQYGLLSLPSVNAVPILIGVRPRATNLGSMYVVVSAAVILRPIMVPAVSQVIITNLDNSRTLQIRGIIASVPDIVSFTCEPSVRVLSCRM